LAGVAVVRAGSHDERHHAAVPGRRYLVPLAVSQTRAARGVPADGQRRDGSARSPEREDRPPAHQLHRDEVRPAAGLRPVVVHQQRVGLRRGEHHGDVVESGVQRRERGERQGLKAEGGALAVAAVAAVGARAPVAGLQGHAGAAVEARVGAARVGHRLALAAPVARPAQTEERAPGGLPARAAVLAGVGVARAPPADLAVAALALRGAHARVVRARAPAAAPPTRVRLAGVLGPLALLA